MKSSPVARFGARSLAMKDLVGPENAKLKPTCHLLCSPIFYFVLSRRSAVGSIHVPRRPKQQHNNSHKGNAGTKAPLSPEDKDPINLIFITGLRHCFGRGREWKIKRQKMGQEGCVGGIDMLNWRCCFERS